MSRIRFRFDDRTLVINNEVCAIITGYDKYAVSMSGNVYNIKTERKLKPGRAHGRKNQYIGNGKYKSKGTGEKINYYRLLVVLLDDSGKHCTKKVHQLVANEWLKETDLNPDGTPIVGRKCINHIDHNTSNNSVFNLEYCDYKYNCNH